MPKNLDDRTPAQVEFDYLVSCYERFRKAETPIDQAHALAALDEQYLVALHYVTWHYHHAGCPVAADKGSSCAS